MHKNLIKALLICCCAGLTACAHAKTVKEGADMEQFTSDGNFFTAMVPKAWAKTERISAGRQAREFGADFLGPTSKDGVPARISLTFFGADHDRFTSVDKYLRINAKPDPDMTVEGEKYGPLTKTKIAGRGASQFEVNTFSFIPPNAVNPKEVPIYEKHIVVPGKKGGFYVLTYHAPADIAKANIGVFDAVVKSFKPAK